MHQNLESLHTLLQRAREQIQTVIIGQDQVIDWTLIPILTGQHALLEGIPGVGKTLLVRTLADVLGTQFNRIQFTPDLMPADITGTHIFNLRDHTFELVEGPLFTSFLLADEINRSPAKTQAALLQAMQERTVTLDRETLALPADFTVFATQNPIEFEGTYPLPEAQKDRFMLKIPMQPLEADEELRLAMRTLGGEAPTRTLESGTVQTVLDPEALAGLRPLLQLATLRDELVEYMVQVVRATRAQESILVGAGPRATEALVQAARALAVIRGRDYVTPDDIQEMAEPVLGHRIILRPEFEIEGLEIPEVIQQVLQQIDIPR